MNTELAILADDLFNGKSVRILGTKKDPLFRANDIENLMGLTNIHVSIEKFNDTEKGVSITYTLQGNQEMTYLTERGYYSLIFFV